MTTDQAPWSPRYPPPQYMPPRPPAKQKNLMLRAVVVVFAAVAVGLFVVVGITGNFDIVE